MTPVTLTVAIPVYNRIDYLPAVLQSVLSQAIAGLEILIVDDGSKEEVWNTLKKWADPRITICRHEKNLGLFPNWNECLRLAQGQYFKILCSDDCLESSTLSQEVAFMEDHLEVGLLSTRGITVDGQNQVLGQLGDLLEPGVYDGPKAIRCLLHHYFRTGVNPFNYPSGIMVRTDIARQVGGFDATMRHVGDLDFFYKVLAEASLGIGGWVGCRITLHPHQAGATQSVKTYGVEENFTIIDRHRHRLQPGEYDTLRHLHCGLTLWYGVKLLVKGKWRGFYEHARIASQHIGGGEWFSGPRLVGCLALFLAWKAYLAVCPSGSVWLGSLRHSRQ